MRRPPQKRAIRPTRQHIRAVRLLTTDAPDILIDHLVEHGKALRRFCLQAETRLFNALASGSGR
ncbi:hypothetical protein ECZU27_48490 [Escherichia coli]|nr:hypothetical protein ECZU27_48490 [Escherichia coli]